jgi:hypothetical protein
MTGAYLMTKTAHGYQPVEVEHLTPAERRHHLQDRDPEEVMRWLDLLCEQIVELEKLLATRQRQTKV